MTMSIAKMGPMEVQMVKGEFPSISFMPGKVYRSYVLTIKSFLMPDFLSQILNSVSVD